MSRLGVLLVVSSVMVACGARSETPLPELLPALEPLATLPDDQVRCAGELDCDSGDLCLPGTCVDGVCVFTQIECDDSDECTDDTCDSTTGECVFEPNTPDVDGDGARAPLPGFVPGSEGACGDDCDDSHAEAYPGGTEVCDGVDNDCNGSVDDGAVFVAAGPEPLLISEGVTQAAVGGLAYTGEYFGIAYAAHEDAWVNRFVGIDANHDVVVENRRITNVNNDTFTGPLVWTGAGFATAWEDRRDEDFEIYFSLLDGEGSKLEREIRITDAPDFSVQADLVWQGDGYVLAWGDRRRDDFQVFAQRVGDDGKPIGDNVELTAERIDGQGPSVAASPTNIGVVFNARGAVDREVRFLPVSRDLTSVGEMVTLSSPFGVGGSVVFNNDRYVAIWHQDNAGPGDSIFAAAVDPMGQVLIGEKRVTQPSAFAASESILPLGDRLLLVWSAWSDGSYDLYAKELSVDLEDRSPVQRVTAVPEDAVNPVIGIGPEGSVGILYQQYSQQRSGQSSVYFTSLTCTTR